MMHDVKTSFVNKKTYKTVHCSEPRTYMCTYKFLHSTSHQKNNAYFFLLCNGSLMTLLWPVQYVTCSSGTTVVKEFCTMFFFLVSALTVMYMYVWLQRKKKILFHLLSFNHFKILRLWMVHIV